MVDDASLTPDRPPGGATRARLVEMFTDADPVEPEAFFADLDEAADAGLRDAYA